MASLMRILVVGATGAQGGSVARHLLHVGRYQVRCLTRNPQSNAAMALERQGAQIVSADLDDPVAMRAAVRDCDGVFGVTNYWEHFEHEVVHGRNLIDAIAGSNVQHTRLLSGGRLEVPHFDTKARIEEYARSSGIAATYVHVAFYYENFLRSLPPRRQTDGSYAFGFPQGNTPLAAVAAEDIGGVVAAIFAESFWYRDKVIGIVGDDLRCDDYAQIMRRLMGRPFAYNHVGHDTFAALGFAGSKDLADMFEFNRLFIQNRRADLARSRELFPEIRSFERWLKNNTPVFERALTAGTAVSAAAL